MATQTIPMFLLSRDWAHNVRMYVTERPGDGGVDWGYSTDATKARPFSLYWAKRFAADCRYVGSYGRRDAIAMQRTATTETES